MRGDVKVVDASALSAVVFAEPDAEEVAARLRDALLVAPALMHFEVTNTCLKKVRRYPEQRAALVAALAMVPEMRIDAVDVEHSEVLALAEQWGLTAYDASYLWLSRRLGAELVTLDAQLEAARVEAG